MPAVRSGSGVARLVEAPFHMTNAQAGPVDERDDAPRGVTDDGDLAPDALDAPRPCNGGDRAQDLAGGELDDRDAGLRVGGDERDRRSTGERARSETQGDGQRHRADEELAAVHVRDTGSGCREVPAGERALDLVRERAFGVDQVVGDRAGSFQQSAVLAQMREVKIGQAGLARSEQLSAAADVEVDLRELEAVVRTHERLEPLLGLLGQ